MINHIDAPSLECAMAPQTENLLLFNRNQMLIRYKQSKQQE